MAVKWYYNSNSGNITDEDENNYYFQLQLHAGIGWHGPFNTQQDAVNYYNANKAKNPGWSAPSDSTLGKIANVTGVSSALTGGLNDDSIRSWLIRIGEILLGIVLVGVGVAKLTGNPNVVASAVKAKP